MEIKRARIRRRVGSGAIVRNNKSMRVSVAFEYPLGMRLRRLCGRFTFSSKRNAPLDVDQAMIAPHLRRPRFTRLGTC